MFPELLEQQNASDVFKNDWTRKRDEADLLHDKLAAQKDQIANVQELDNEVAEALKGARTDLNQLRTEAYTNIKQTNEYLFSKTYANENSYKNTDGTAFEASRMYQELGGLFRNIKNINPDYTNASEISTEYTAATKNLRTRAEYRIARLQAALKLMNCCPSSWPFDIDINGKFDNNTVSAMLYFQTKNPYYLPEAKWRKWYKIDWYFMSRTLHAVNKMLEKWEIISSTWGTAPSGLEAIDQDKKALDAHMAQVKLDWLKSDYKNEANLTWVASNFLDLTFNTGTALTGAQYTIQVEGQAQKPISNGGKVQDNIGNLPAWAHNITIIGTYNWKTSTRNISFIISSSNIEKIEWDPTFSLKWQANSYDISDTAEKSIFPEVTNEANGKVYSYKFKVIEQGWTQAKAIVTWSWKDFDWTKNALKFKPSDLTLWKTYEVAIEYDIDAKAQPKKVLHTFTLTGTPELTTNSPDVTSQVTAIDKAIPSIFDKINAWQMSLANATTKVEWSGNVLIITNWVDQYRLTKDGANYTLDVTMLNNVQRDVEVYRKQANGIFFDNTIWIVSSWTNTFKISWDALLNPYTNDLKTLKEKLGLLTGIAWLLNNADAGLKPITVVPRDKKQEIINKPLDLDPTLKLGLNTLYTDASGIIHWWNEDPTLNINYFIRKSDGKGWRTRPLSQDERNNSEFDDGTEIAVSRTPNEDPKAKEIFTVKRQKQTISSWAVSSLVPEKIGAGRLDNNGTVDNISSGAYERESEMKQTYFTNNFPALSTEWYPNPKEGDELKNFITTYVKPIYENKTLSVDDRIKKVRDIISQLASTTAKNLPSSIDVTGKVVFEGWDLDETKFFWIIDRRNNLNQKSQYHAIMTVYSNQVEHHINKTINGVYTYNIKDRSTYNEHDASLAAQRDKFTKTNTLENTTRERLSTRYGEYNTGVINLKKIVVRYKQLETNLAPGSTTYLNDKTGEANARMEQLSIMKERVKLESWLLLLAKKIDYLQWSTGKLITENDAKTQLTNLYTTANQLITGIDTYISKNSGTTELDAQVKKLKGEITDLSTFINSPSKNWANPSLVDAAYMFGIALSKDPTSWNTITTPIAAQPFALAEKSKIILDARNEINKLQQEQKQKERELGLLQPGQPDYKDKYKAISAEIGTLTPPSGIIAKIAEQQKKIDTVDKEYSDYIISITPSGTQANGNLVASTYYKSLQASQGTWAWAQTFLLTPIVSPSPLSTTQTEMSKKYGEKQTGLPAKISDNQTQRDNRDVPVKARDTANTWIKARKDKLGSDIAEFTRKIEASRTAITAEQAKSSPDTGKILEEQQNILTKNKERQEAIAQYNTLHYEYASTFQQELYVEKVEVDAYTEATENNITHLTTQKDNLKKSIEQRITNINEIRVKYKALVESSFDEDGSKVKFNTSETANLLAQAQVLYKEITWEAWPTQDPTRASFDTWTDLKFDTLVWWSTIAGSSLYEYQQTLILLQGETSKLTKWKLISGYQQSRIDLIGIDAQVAMMDANITNRDWYHKVLQKQFSDNEGSAAKLKSDNIGLELKYNAATTTTERTSIRTSITKNESTIADIGARNDILKGQIATLGKAVGDARTELVKMKNNQTKALQAKSSLNQQMTANTTPVYKDGSNNKNEFKLSDDKTVTYKPFESLWGEVIPEVPAPWAPVWPDIPVTGLEAEFNANNFDNAFTSKPSFEAFKTWFANNQSKANGQKAKEAIINKINLLKRWYGTLDASKNYISTNMYAPAGSTITPQDDGNAITIYNGIDPNTSKMHSHLLRSTGGLEFKEIGLNHTYYTPDLKLNTENTFGQVVEYNGARVWELHILWKDYSAKFINQQSDPTKFTITPEATGSDTGPKIEPNLAGFIGFNLVMSGPTVEKNGNISRFAYVSNGSTEVKGDLGIDDYYADLITLPSPKYWNGIVLIEKKTGKITLSDREDTTKAEMQALIAAKTHDVFTGSSIKRPGVALNVAEINAPVPVKDSPSHPRTDRQLVQLKNGDIAALIMDGQTPAVVEKILSDEKYVRAIHLDTEWPKNNVYMSPDWKAAPVAHGTSTAWSHSALLAIWWTNTPK
jgi:hypothetical protein